MQKTIKQEVSTTGTGLFTGEYASVVLRPAPPNTGVVFQRVDLVDAPRIPAHLSFVRETPRCTSLASESATIHMVEHLLSAIRGLGIDNVQIDVVGPEIPAGDGSAQLFVDLLLEAGLEEQEEKQQFLRIEKPVYWSQGKVHLVAIPADTFQISYTMHYPQSSLLGSQYYTVQLTPEIFQKEIASCRTFSLYEEIAPFIERGIIKGGGLENALVIKEEKILNPGGARFPNEMVRHKVLDLIGDLSLIRKPILGHILSICSGHASNIAFARQLAKMES
jgi:UDP-3-O-[3-hydroxymyristoyl] N-acetylglucosamine deacetylase